MKVNMQVAVPGASLFKRDVEIDVPEGTTLMESIDLYIKKYNANDILGKKLGLNFLVNGERGEQDKVLSENDKVKIFRPRIRG